MSMSKRSPWWSALTIFFDPKEAEEAMQLAKSVIDLVEKNMGGDSPITYYASQAKLMQRKNVSLFI